MRILALLLALVLAPPAAAVPPNIVIVFADDLGYGDLGCFGQDRWETPHIDRLAREGTAFTSFYVAQPVCSASRAALLTGCYPNRIGIRGALGPGAEHGISADETTLAEVCRSKGYATGAFGKWHLGHLGPFHPTNHGFDEWMGIPYSNDMWPFHPEHPTSYPPLPYYDGRKLLGYNVEQGRYTKELTERCVDFIRRSAGEPFFAYLAHPMPHVPLAVSSDFEGRSGVGLYGDVAAEIDWSVGRILETLEELGLDDDTLVIFTSDNGPWLSYGDHAGTTGGLREGKGTTFDGGVRVPCVARWPGHVPAGRRCDVPWMTIDVLPTVVSLLDAEMPERTIDGRDASGVLLGTSDESPQEAYFFYYHGNDLEAVRSGRWKLHFPHRYRTMIGRDLGSGGTPGKYDQRRTEFELYDLDGDPNETTNVADARPDVVAKLVALADVMRDDLGDALNEIEPTNARAPGRVVTYDGRKPFAPMALDRAPHEVVPAKAHREVFRDDMAVIAVGAKPGQVVADIGCGRGRHVAPVAVAVGSAGKLYCRDPFEPAIERVHEIVAEESLDNVDVAVSTNGDVMLPEASIDVAFMADVFQYVLSQEDTREAFMESLRAAMKPGGVVVVTYSRSAHLFKEDERRQIWDDTLAQFVARGFTPGARYVMDVMETRPIEILEFQRPE